MTLYSSAWILTLDVPPGKLSAPVVEGATYN